MYLFCIISAFDRIPATCDTDGRADAFPSAKDKLDAKTLIQGLSGKALQAKVTDLAREEVYRRT